MLQLLMKLNNWNNANLEGIHQTFEPEQVDTIEVLFQDYLRCIPNVCTTFLNIFPKKSFVIAPKVDKKHWNSFETLKDTGGLKLVMTFYLHLYCQSLNFEICFFEFRGNICLSVTSENFLYLQFLENAKGTVTVKYLTLFWNKIFVHLILKMIEV